MGLEKIIDKLSGTYHAAKEFVNREYKFFEASYFFLGTRVFDFMTTKYALLRDGAEAEAMPVPRWFMQQQGIDQGLLMHQMLLSGAVIAGAYYLNNRKFKKVSGNNILYGATAVGLAVGVNNYFETIGISLPLLAIQAIDKIF